MSESQPPIYQVREFLDPHPGSHGVVTANVPTPRPRTRLDGNEYCGVFASVTLSDRDEHFCLYLNAENDKEYHEADEQIGRLIGILVRARDAFKSAHMTAKAYRDAHVVIPTIPRGSEDIDLGSAR